MDKLQKQYKQRQALENAYSNFVEVHIPNLTVVPSASLLQVGCVVGWLAIALLYCLNQKRRREK
ncbi:MAG: hypothetical protein AB4042_14995 [Leptolyngbyaceae cyanobacterium]